MRNDEIADRRRSRVQPRANLVERRAERRRVADERQRLQVREPLEPLGQLYLAILAGRVKRRRVRITQPRHAPFPRLKMPPVEIVQPVARAHPRRLVGRFVVPRQHVNLIRARLQNGPAPVQPLRPRRLVPRRDIVIRLDLRAALRALSNRCGCRRKRVASRPEYTKRGRTHFLRPSGVRPRTISPRGAAPGSSPPARDHTEAAG
jgi:hypothetical protein